MSPPAEWAARIPPRAEVAQLVEHMTENHGVAGSIPALGTPSHFLNTKTVGYGVSRAAILASTALEHNVM